MSAPSSLCHRINFAFLFAFSFLLMAGLTVAAEPSQGEKLRGELPRVLAEADPGDLIPVSIVLADQLSGERLRSVAEGLTDRDQRRNALVGALKAHADRTQAGLRIALDSASEEKQAVRIRYLWIGNIVAAELTPGWIRTVAAAPEVSHVNWAPKVDVFLERDRTPDRLRESLFEDSGLDESTITEIECGTDLMQAPRVWDELANTGDGAVVAVIDSGVCWYHPDIENQIWVNPGEDLDADGVVMDNDDMNGVDDDSNGYVDDLIGYDIENRDTDPNDNNSHGSHCAGTVAGDGTSGTQAGMAPDARIMVLRVGLTFSDEPDVWEAMQYAAENGADAISMSLGWPHSQNPDRETWRNNCENTIDLGTAMVIAAGNEGQGNEPDNLRTPGDVPRVITVGATDCSDNIASFSSRGPVTWQDVPPFNDHPYPPGLVKPDVSAPGVSTKSHNLCSGYSNKSGTSMATPHVAGAVALMVAANPGLTHDDLKFLLEDTSLDLGDAGKDNVFGSGRVDAYEAVLRCQTSNGIVSIKEASVSCDDTLTLVVADQDLKGTGTVNLEVHSTTESAPETAVLTETSGSSGVFRGEIGTAAGAPVPDGSVQVNHGDVITATYVDADDGEGGLNVVKTDTADADCLEPVISDVDATDITTSRAVIRWSTDELSNSEVLYGPETPPGDLSTSGGLVNQHAVTVNGLNECTVYYYEVASADTHGNEARDDNGGHWYHFETYGDFGAGLQPCHAGQVTVDDPVYACNDTATFRVVDIDLNLDSGTADTAVLHVSSTTETVPEPVTAVETGPNTSTFAASIAVAPGAPATDGVLQVSGGDLLTVTYLDQDDGTGSTSTSFDTSALDCSGPVIQNLYLIKVTDQRLTVRFDLPEPGNARVDYGLTPALGQTVSNAAMATTHQLLIRDLELCSPLYMRVSSTDAYGNTTVADLGGTPFRVHTWDIPGLYWMDDFENGAAGWTLEGEWEIGQPQGIGGSSGYTDPSEAYNNLGVLGHDLSGQGSYPGDYEPLINEAAQSPAQDATSWTNTKLMFRKRLNANVGDEASVWLWSGGAGRPLVLSGEESVRDLNFELMSMDVADAVDGFPSVYLKFVQKADGSVQYSGWNVDDIIFKDGSLPDYGACGGCATAPSFAGAVSASDNDACGATGVTVSWEGPVSWGTGGGGTYVVYRDTSPGFTPSASNRIASGVSTLSYDDASAPTDATLYYLVRAESDETCGTGPNNGGMLDGNEVYAAVSETTSRPLPAEVTTVQGGLVNHAHVRLSWDAVPDATGYRVYRSEDPQPGAWVLVGETDGLFWEDLNQSANGNTYHYSVVGVNPCGQEGP